jgi:cytidylate kinase
MRITKLHDTRSIEHLIGQQVIRWKLESAKKTEEKPRIPVITVSRQFGSGGYDVAKQVAEELGLDLFDREIIQKVAESAQMRAALMESLDERAISSLEDMLSAALESQHLWSYEYLQHLVKVIGAIGKHGNAVIVGRGANFMLPQDTIVRIRIVAPLEMRTKNVIKELDMAYDDAKQLIVKKDSEKKAFIKKHFNADIDDLQNYDLIINRRTISADAAVKAIKAILPLSQ